MSDSIFLPYDPPLPLDVQSYYADDLERTRYMGTVGTLCICARAVGQRIVIDAFQCDPPRKGGTRFVTTLTLSEAHALGALLQGLK